MKIKRETTNYTLTLPNVLYDQLGFIANKHNISVAEVLRSFIRLGMIAAEIENTPNASILIQEGEDLRELVLFPKPDEVEK